MDIWLIRIVLFASMAGLGYASSSSSLLTTVAFSAVAIFVIAAEWRFRQATRVSAQGIALGAVGGALASAALTVPLSHWIAPGSLAWVALPVLCVYIGGVIGARSGQRPVATNSTIPVGERKILDTSVLIDGRIADIAETGFLDGVLVIPQFVLRELQMVADSADALRRNRGRRGLDILHRLQKITRVKVEIVEDDFPAVREVDMKLLELAKAIHAKVVTNDFNLNKVAQVRGVEVLNINELTNSLRPVVLPGEQMRVFILKEGKEANQGVAYLDDGTMVVVDNARRHISKTIDISVTSVLQTTAGKMIFGRFDERQHVVHDSPKDKPVASSVATS